MDKFWESGWSASPPGIPPGGGIGYPAEGGIGIPRTVPGAYWFYMVATEILNEILAASITPNKAVLTQLRDSITTRIANSQYDWAGNSSLGGTSGFEKFPNGVIHNFKSIAGTASPQALTVTWATPFTNRYIGGPSLSIIDNSGIPPGSANILICSMRSLTLSGMTVDVGDNGGGTRAYTLTVNAWGV